MSTYVSSWDWSAWPGDPIGLSEQEESNSRTKSSTSGGALGADACYRLQCLRISSMTSPRGGSKMPPPASGRRTVDKTRGPLHKPA